MIRRLWNWLRGLFRRESSYSVRTLTVDEEHEYRRRERQGANICLASHGATRREKDNAWNRLLRIEENLRDTRWG